VKFEFEQFSTIEDVFLYLASVAPYMKQLLPVSSYRGYVFSTVPLSQLSGEVLTMVYTKGSIDAGFVEFDISTKKYKSVTWVERADKNYFIILIPKSTSISDSAIAQLESSKTAICPVSLLSISGPDNRISRSSSIICLYIFTVGV
jgi:hypothetical protein